MKLPFHQETLANVSNRLWFYFHQKFSSKMLVMRASFGKSWQDDKMGSKRSWGLHKHKWENENKGKVKIVSNQMQVVTSKKQQKKKQKKFKPQSYHKIIHYDRGKNQRLGKTIQVFSVGKLYFRTFLTKSICSHDKRQREKKRTGEDRRGGGIISKCVSVVSIHELQTMKKP